MASEEKQQMETQQSAVIFIDVKRCLSEVERLVYCNLTECSNEEIIERRTNMKEIGANLNEISKNITLLLQINGDAKELDGITSRYEKVSAKHSIYEEQLMKEVIK